jgi:hypothetical protein
MKNPSGALVQDARLDKFAFPQSLHPSPRLTAFGDSHHSGVLHKGL